MFTTTKKTKGELKRLDQVIYNMPISLKLEKTHYRIRWCLYGSALAWVTKSWLLT